MNYILLISFFISSCLGTLLIRWIAIRRNILDIPNSRSSHIKPTPRGGGIAITVCWYLAVSILYNIGSIELDLYSAILSSIPIAIIGFYDDMISIKPIIRLSIQIVCSAAALFFLDGISFDYPHGITILINVLVLIGIVWFINLFNFLDGIDGYVSAGTIFICAAFSIFAGEVFPLFLAVIVCGFLIWNWQPAKIFMGDVSSTVLGFSVSILGIHYINSGKASMASFLILTSVFWFDATITLMRRLLNRESLFVAHRKHAYQRIVQYGFSHKKTVLYSLILNIAILFLAILALQYSHLALIFLATDMLILQLIMHSIDKRFPF